MKLGILSMAPKCYSTARLRQAAEEGALTLPAQNLPAWFFALMLELFSSQGTSIALVSLLLLYAAKPQEVADELEPDLIV